jgi:mevalonate kinase
MQPKLTLEEQIMRNPSLCVDNSVIYNKPVIEFKKKIGVTEIRRFEGLLVADFGAENYMRFVRKRLKKSPDRVESLVTEMEKISQGTFRKKRSSLPPPNTQQSLSNVTARGLPFTIALSPQKMA